MKNSSPSTILTRGRAGWQGQQGSLTGVAVLACALGIFVIAWAVLLLTEPSRGMTVMGIAVLFGCAVSVWILVAHLRVGRKRVLRVVASPGRLVFGGPAGVRLPQALLLAVGVLFMAGWVWAFADGGVDRMPRLTLTLTPLLAVLLAFGGARALFTGTIRHALVLTPEEVEIRLPRNALRARWDEVASAVLEGNRVVLRTKGGRTGAWGVRDFASDPVVLAELITFYAQDTVARAEIGEAALSRLRDGGF